MSYCRFGDSDAYIYSDGRRIHCMSCKLLKRHFFAYTSASMLRHVIAHLKRGHSIPDATLVRLVRESAVRT